MKKSASLLLIGSFIVLMVFLTTSFAQAATATVCCQKTVNNLACQNVPVEQCAVGSPQAPTACVSTSFCKPGVCYNPNEGTCAENTPQIVCNQNGGTWSAAFPPQCNLGCCVLGDQAALVTLVRCKYLSGTLGLQTNFNKGITTETACIATVQNQDKGACVYDLDYVKTCKVSTRQECLGGVNGTTKKGDFFKDSLCTNPELGTNCAKTKKTTCVPGKEEVYFVDTCGNPSNIYDASKENDDAYWKTIVPKEQSCQVGTSGRSAQSCGNCNYLLGSICRPATTSATKPIDGDNICADLNCPKTSAGFKRHGESWCVFNDSGTIGQGKDSVGSRFYMHSCNNGQEVVEACDDFRGQECIQDSITYTGGTFSQAACRANRWKDCLFQTEQLDCENTDQRDCLWKAGYTYTTGNITSGTGVCIPKNPPGLTFWQSADTKTYCAAGSAQCIVEYDKDLFGNKKCVKNCNCLEEDWFTQRTAICNSLGDCGPNVNWIGQTGWKAGYNYTVTKA